MNLGQLIRSKRKEKGLTQGEVAAYIDVSTNTVSKYERNIIANMGREKVIGLSKLLDIPTVAFIEAIDELEEDTNVKQINRDDFNSELNRLANLAETEEQKKQIIDFIKFVTKNDDK